MSKLLDDAITELRKLPEFEQDAAAEALFAHISGADLRYRLSDEQAKEVTRRQLAFREGRAHFATDEEMNALWKKCGL